MYYRLILCSAVLTLLGCGDGLSVYPVTGKVTLDGQAISGASITFQPVEGGTGMPAVGSTDSNGQYSLTDMRSENIGGGAEPGDYRVGVLWYKPSVDTSNATGEGGGPAEDEEVGDAKSRQTVSGPDSLLPAAYQNPKTSGLQFTVTTNSADNTFDIELVSSFKGEGK